MSARKIATASQRYHVFAERLAAKGAMGQFDCGWDWRARMILTCPQCSTRYQADAARFPPSGRNVRCAKCGHQWLQIPPPPEPDVAVVTPEIVDQPAPVAVPRETRSPASESAPEFPPPAAQTSQARTRIPGWAGWAGLGVLLVLVALAFFSFRTAVLARWPQSASLYKAVGLPANVSGIQLDGVTNRLENDHGEHVLVVTGRLVNTSGREQPVPQIRIALTDAGRRELYHWPVLPAVPVLKPGQSAPFHARLADPPRAMEDVEVTFYRSGE